MGILKPNFGCHLSAKIGSELPAFIGWELPALTVYFDSQICNDEIYQAVVYNYSGNEITPDQIDSILDLIDIVAVTTLIEAGNFEQDALLGAARIAMTGGSLSGGVFVIDAYDNFVSPESYSGGFETVSLSGKLKAATGSVFYSYSDTCQVYGIKIGMGYEGFLHKPSLPISFSYSRTEYSMPYYLS